MRRLRVVMTGALLWVVTSGVSSAATIYLDGTLANNCTGGNYSIAARNCSGSNGNAYRTIQSLPISGGDTVLIRGCSAGSCPDAQWKYLGPFFAPPGGPSATNRTTIKNYNNEQVLICSSQRACNLGYPRDAQGNADMDSYSCGNRAPHWCDGGSNDGGYCTGASNCPGGSCSIRDPHAWYGNRAIGLGDNTLVDGIKTWGAAAVFGDNSTIQNSDLGGCGVPSQGHVVRIENSSNALLKNNFIHHSCKNIDGAPGCSGDSNGTAVFGYDWQATIENNEIFDFWYGAIRMKDGGSGNRPGTGGDMVIRNNFIRNTSIWNNGQPQAGEGPYCFEGYQQDIQIDNVHFYKNICYRSSIIWDGAANIETVAFNNTLIDPYEGSWQWFNAGQVKFFNNLSYVHTNGNHHFRMNNGSMANVSMEANLYWGQSANSGRWDFSNTERATTLAGWQSWTDSQGQSQDDLSVEINPQFANVGCIASDTCVPADFKRNAYNENFASHTCGSRSFGGATGLCGARAGAYVTGNEIIGVDAATNPYWNLHHGPVVAACADGVDNDGDGNTDLADSNCSGAADSTESQCGDGAREPGAEVCDGADLGGQTCVTQGQSSGTLSCNASCNGFVLSACTGTPPGQVDGLRFVN